MPLQVLPLLLALTLAACVASQPDPFAEGVACEPLTEATNPPPLLVGGLQGLALQVEGAASGPGRVTARVVVNERGRGEAATLEWHTGPAPDSTLLRVLEGTTWQPGSAMGRPARWACTVAFAYGA